MDSNGCVCRFYKVAEDVQVHSISTRKVSGLLAGQLHSKISSAIKFACRASIYDSEVTAYELTTAQCVILGILHGLVNNDVVICSLLGAVSSNIQHLQSSYLKLWLKEDFRFNSQEIYHAFSAAAHYITSGILTIPFHILQILVSVVERYEVEKTCKEVGDSDTLSLLASLGVNVERKGSNEENILAVAAQVFIEDESADIAQTSENVILHTERPSGEQNSTNVQKVNTQAGPSGITMNKPMQGSAKKQTDNLSWETINRSRETSISYEYGSDFDESYDDSDDKDFDDCNSESSYEDKKNEPNPLPSNFNGCHDTLHKAAEEGNITAIRTRLRQGDDVESRDRFHRTPAHLAAIAGKLEVLKILDREAGANLSSIDNRGDSLLHDAAGAGHSHVVRWLIRNGADVESPGRGGWRPIHRAAQNGDTRTVNILLNHGACPNMLATVGGTALHRAAYWNNIGVARILISRGTFIDLPDNRSDTPLHLAAKRGHYEMVLLLLEEGANPNVTDRNDLTPYMWAVRMNWNHVAELFNSCGVDNV